MLVLTRKAGEEILIGDDISLVVTRVSGNRVTIGVKAPKDKKIVRGELRIYEGDELGEEGMGGMQEDTPPLKLRIAR